MKIAKYILSIFLILGGFGFISKSDFIAGLFILILGGILLPPNSDKIKKKVILFKDKKIRYGIYVMLFAISGVFMSKSEAKLFGSKEGVLVKYIKNNKTDKPLQDIRRLAEIGSLFGNNNYSITYRQQDYISERYDSVKKVSVLTFNPKFNYSASENISFLKDDIKNGKLKSYAIQYEIDKDNNVTLKKTTISYSKIIKEFLTVTDVPNVETFVDEVVIKLRKEQLANEERIANERRKFNRIMGDDDFWNKFDPIVKKRIYKLIINKNCKGLQNEYNTVAKMMERKQASGIGASKEVDLADFLDSKMRNIDCY